MNHQPNRTFSEKVAASFIVLLALPLLFISPSMLSAYYHVPDDESLTVRLKVDAGMNSSGNAPQSFALFSNDDVPISAGSQYIVPMPDRFVAADIVFTNKFLGLAMQKPIRTDSTLSSILYANLKLKRLVELYEELQRNSTELLSGLSVPVVESNSFFTATTATSAPSMTQKRDALTAGYQSISRQFRSQSATNSLGNFEEISTVQMETLLELVTRIRTSDGKTVSGTDYQLLFVGGESIQTDRSSTGQGSTSLSTRSAGDTSLPKIFEICLSLIRYFFSHKTETILLGLVIMLLVMLISSIKR